jgi:hypothetical protein
MFVAIRYLLAWAANSGLYALDIRKLTGQPVRLGCRVIYDTWIWAAAVRQVEYFIYHIISPINGAKNIWRPRRRSHHYKWWWSSLYCQSVIYFSPLKLIRFREEIFPSLLDRSAAQRMRGVVKLMCQASFEIYYNMGGPPTPLPRVAGPFLFACIISCVSFTPLASLKSVSE